MQAQWTQEGPYKMLDCQFRIDTRTNSIDFIANYCQHSQTKADNSTSPEFKSPEECGEEIATILKEGYTENRT